MAAQFAVPRRFPKTMTRFLMPHLAAAMATVLTLVARAEVPDPVLNFALLDHHGRMQELKRLDARAVVLFFTSVECPVARQSAPKLLQLQEKYEARGVKVLLVNASSGDDRRSIGREAYQLGIPHLPVLVDEAQALARHLGAKRTGETFVIRAADWKVVYHGAFDNQLAEGAQKPEATESFVEQAVESLLAGKTELVAGRPARGCVIHFDGDGAPESGPVSYAKDIVPILQAKCVGCHSPGNVGPWAMTAYKRVKGMASMIEEVLLTRRMPPWDADPHIGKFANDRSLTVAETQTLVRWIHQGAPRGDGEDPLEALHVPPAADWPLGEPDLVIRLPEVQQVPATGVLDYRHVTVQLTNAEPGWIAAAYVRPGNRKIVHHVIARLQDGGQKDHLGDEEMLIGWAPGSTQEFYPEGSGKFLPARAKFDLELHYTTCGTAETDGSEIGLYLRRQPVTRRFESVPVVNPGFEIRPGDGNAEQEAVHCFTKPVILHGVTPHMHLRGKSMRFELLFPDGRSETVASIPRYDFNWQFTYDLAKPMAIPAGTWVRLVGAFDNSKLNPSNPDPTKTVRWGKQSFDEMFLGWYNVTWDLPKDAAAGGAP